MSNRHPPTDSHQPHRLQRARVAVCGLVLAGALLADAAPAVEATADEPLVLLALGAPGEETYAPVLEKAAQDWERACQAASAQLQIIGRGPTNAVPDLDQLRSHLEAAPKEAPSELWLVFVGHGTFDGRDAKFNLRGPDLGVETLAGWLKPFRRPLVIVHGGSASGPFLTGLSAPGRVVITATRSGEEQNYARFGAVFAATVADPTADLDRDGQTSLFEAFLATARRVEEFYQTDSRLPTEHALLDDNGDRRGTPANWFRGLRPTRQAEDGAAVDGLRAHQVHLVRAPGERLLPPGLRQRRDELEQAIARLRDAKAAVPEEEYYRQLETLLLALARLYQAAH